MQKYFFVFARMSLSIGALLALWSCKSNNANQTAGDIQTVVDEADQLVNILESSAVVSSQDKGEAVAALQFAEAASRAAWASASESNSNISISRKNESIADYFSKVHSPVLKEIANLNIRAAEEQLAGSIELLLGQIASNRAAIAANPGLGDAVPQSIPQILTGRLNNIRQSAIDNIAAADSLLARLQK